MRALIELIHERGFEAITVSEITARANVGRSTFYAHFADKEDLLQGSIGRLQEYLLGHVKAALADPAPDAHPALAFCLPMLEHADQNRTLFAAMVGQRSGYLLLDLFHDMWADLVRAGWPEADEVAVQAIVGAFGSTLSWWLDKAPELSSEQVRDRFRQVIEPTLPRLRP